MLLKDTFDINEELKKLPGKPGVYLMHDDKDEIIYVGKAISLKNRVRQYFQASRNVTPKIARMIEQIAYFEYIVTDSEREALVLECNLIKEYSPKYNTMLKDDKGYPFIRATVNETFPRLMLVRERKRDKAKYFGPYTSVYAVRDIIELSRKLYYIRDCRRILPRDTGKERPCLYYHIHQCKAPCQGYISAEEYQKNFNKVLDLLNGNVKEILSDLENKMNEHSEAMEFEEAAECRDLIRSVKHVALRQKITGKDLEDRDIIAMARSKEEAVVQVFFVRSGSLIGREHFYLTGVEDETESQVLAAFVKQMYAGTPYIPKELLMETQIDDEETILDWLSAKRGDKVYAKIPQRGDKEQLMELAKHNAFILLTQNSEKLKREEEKTTGALAQIAQWLDMDELDRVESYDISNINGFQTVGSMVVFEKGKAKHNDYRKFRIRSVAGPDDYAAMEEMLTRRIEHGLRDQQEGKDSFSRFPDLIMMDGGKGQVNVALRVLDKLNISIPVCGMVKDDNHRTRGLYFNNIEIPIDTHSEGFHLITRIQDETHRFAIDYHRSLRGKAQVKSILDDIPGVGQVRRKALMKYFESINHIKSATVEELKAVPGMNEKAAQQIVDFFRERSTN